MRPVAQASVNLRRVGVGLPLLGLIIPAHCALLLPLGPNRLDQGWAAIAQFMQTAGDAGCSRGDMVGYIRHAHWFQPSQVGYAVPGQVERPG